MTFGDETCWPLSRRIYTISYEIVTALSKCISVSSFWN